MKKLLLPLLILAALCLCHAAGAEAHEHFWTLRHNEYAHWAVCSTCGEETEKEYHYIFCDAENENECAVCGAKTEDGAIIPYMSHSFSGVTFVVDQAYHYYACERCGDILQNEYNQPILDYHQSICLEPDVCAICGASEADGIQIRTVHHNWVTRCDNECHWDECTLCGDKTPRIVHYVSCVSANPGVCTVCGASAAEGAKVDYVKHNYSEHILDADAYEHWYPCADCGARVKSEKHYGSCKNPDTCQVCQQTARYNGAVMDRVEHLSYNGEWKHNEQEHWYVCICGETLNKGAHFAICAEPGVCHMCGAPCDLEPVHYTASDAECVFLDAESHQFRCDFCFQPAWEKHQWQDGVCVRCGYKKKAEELPKPVYSLKDVAYNGQEITGTLAHDPTTAAAEQVSVRVTFFVTGNYYMATVAEVEPDGSFAVEGVGPIEYITLLASGSEGTLTAADLVID